MAIRPAAAARPAPAPLIRPGLVEETEDRDLQIVMALSADLKGDKWHIPPLPRAAAELMRITSDPEAPVAKIIALIERDMGLATRVLRLASSAAFGSGKVADLRRAVAKIGNVGVRNVAMASAMSGAFGAGAMARWAQGEMEHAYVVATGAAYLCGQLALDPAVGFLAGLMHDVGCLALLSVLVTQAQEQKRLLSVSTAMPVLTELHADAGALVAHSWGLDNDVLAAIRLHHLVAEATVSRTTLVVALADAAEEVRHPDAEEHMNLLMNHPARIELRIGHTEVLELVHCIADERAQGAGATSGGG